MRESQSQGEQGMLSPCVEKKLGVSKNEDKTGVAGISFLKWGRGETR